jgi:hypothetical protein
MSPTRPRCPRCRRGVPADTVYCVRCGALLEEEAAPAQPERKLRPWVYVVAAVLAATLVWSGALAAHTLLGTEETAETEPLPPPPPEVSLSAPREVELTGSTNVRLAAEVKRPAAGGRLDFFVDGRPLSGDGSAPYEAKWRPERPGDYEVSATLLDAAGRPVDSDTTRVAVREAAVEPPEVRILLPEDGSVYAPGEQVRVLVETETPLAIEEVSVTANGAELWSGTGPELDFFWTPTDPGYRTLQASATDERGQRADSTAVGVRIPAPEPEPPADETQAVGDAVAGHYMAIGAGDLAGAYSYFSPGFRQGVERAGWIRNQRSYEVRGATINSLIVDSVSGDTAVATVNVSFTDNTGNPNFTITWRLVRVGEQWLLDRQL